jgi:hypothetical protein
MSFFSLKKAALVGIVGAGLFVNGCLTNDDDDKDEDTTPVVNTTPLVAADTLSVGAQGNATLGSALELDLGLVYSSSQANANLEDVDLVFMYYTNAYHIDNTMAARAAGVANSINLTNTYDQTKVKDNKFVKVTSAPANQEAAKKAFTDAATKLATSTVSNGDMFIVQTTDGDYAFVKVVAVTGASNTGAADFSVSVTTIP